MKCTDYGLREKIMKQDIIFSYSCSGAWGFPLSCIILYAEGTLKKIQFRKEDKVLFQNLRIAEQVKTVIESNKTLLDNLPKNLFNASILDGFYESVILGQFHFMGDNFIGSEVPSGLQWEGKCEDELDDEYQFACISKFQDVFWQIKELLETEVSASELWEFEEEEKYPCFYESDCSGILDEDELEYKEYRIGEEVPIHNSLADKNSRFILGSIIKNRSSYEFDFTTTDHKFSSGYGMVRKGWWIDLEYIDKRNNIVPVITKIEDISESHIVLRIDGIRKDYLKRSRRRRHERKNL